MRSSSFQFDIPTVTSPYHQEEILDSADLLLDKRHVLVHGPALSGKTALARHLFLTLAGDPATPALYVDADENRPHPTDAFLRGIYHSQFLGDYDLWRHRHGKTIVIDNFASRPTHLKFVNFVRDHFDRIVVLLTSSVYESYYRDERDLADFTEVQIEPLTHGQQEDLIRRHVALSREGRPVPDGHIDQIEDRINSVITSQRIMPRYPFFVLSILQALEAYMPTSFAITSYGHCYKALIVAKLIKAGIASRDQDINPCLNFAERLAFQQYCAKRGAKSGDTSVDFKDFVRRYKNDFHIADASVSRLRHSQYGLLNERGDFRALYTYYYFLGMFLAKNSDGCHGIIDEMCRATYLPKNYLTLLFVIHHTESKDVIDEILLRTLCALETVEPARLDRSETNRFGAIVSALPRDVLSGDDVEDERRRESGRGETRRSEPRRRTGSRSGRSKEARRTTEGTQCTPS